MAAMLQMLARSAPDMPVVPRARTFSNVPASATRSLEFSRVSKTFSRMFQRQQDAFSNVPASARRVFLRQDGSHNLT